MYFLKLTSYKIITLAIASLPLAASLFYKGNSGKTCSDMIRSEYPTAQSASLVFSIVPGLLANFIGDYLHPYVSNDKYVKYGLTALESSLFSVFFIKAFSDQKKLVNALIPQFGNMLSSISSVSLFSEALVIGAAVQAVTYKYLFNDSEKTPVELDLDSGSETIL